MKISIIKLISCVLMLFSLSAYADKIILNGRPVTLIPADTYYTFPKGYTQLNKYPFVRINDVDRVCFLNKIPELAHLDMLRFTILQSGKKFLWFCYRYDSRYFTINF